MFEEFIDIPSDSNVLRREIVLDFDVEQRDAIALYLHNHGSNTYTFHSLEALIEGEFDRDEFCESYDSTFEAIQSTVFAQANCTNSQCHSSDSAAGGLDLSPEVAYDNLIGVPAVASEHVLVSPTQTLPELPLSEAGRENQARQLRCRRRPDAIRGRSHQRRATGGVAPMD